MTADIDIHCLGGNCPVQAEGYINGKPFYFRSRGEFWSMEIGEGPAPWSYGERYGSWPDAGWITAAEARAFIRKAADLYAAAMPHHPRQSQDA